MTEQQAVDFCLSFKGAVMEYPFDNVTRVFKVCGKIFALCYWRDDRLELSLKSDPALAQELRQTHKDIMPGWHLNKEHWNTINLGGSVPEDELKWLVGHSYGIVVKALTKKQRAGLEC